ncbi:hypothetical protein [Kitasatospora sp. NBC_00315]|uniref:hypothetical protein n=1 Tax=Kitasatospora sp. NBC_00315 TaxID=2975963 RepID=UPI00324F72C8
MDSDARRRAARRGYSRDAAATDHGAIRAAMSFTRRLDDQQTDLARLSQRQLDVWLTEAKPTHRRSAQPSSSGRTSAARPGTWNTPVVTALCPPSSSTTSSIKSNCDAV